LTPTPGGAAGSRASAPASPANTRAPSIPRSSL
jgi:hypothetical protein